MSLKTLVTLVAPGAIVLTAAGVLPLLEPTANMAAQAARGYPFVALTVAALLAWRMHRSRLVYAALLLLLTHATLSVGAFDADGVATLFAAFLVPLLIAVVGLTSDRSVGTRHSFMQALLVFVPVCGAAVLIETAPAEARAWLLGTFVDPIYIADWTRLPQVALVSGVLALGVLTAVALYRARVLDAGLGWTALAGLLAVSQPAGTTGRGLWMLAGGIILIVALVESSYMMAFHDELTGLPARRALSQALASLRPPYTVAIVDVDHFKSFNDRYGHDVGDEVLRMVATRLEGVKGGGQAFRSGGEEFTLVFAGKTKAEALVYVEEVREAVAAARFTLRRKPRPTKADGKRKRGTRNGNERRIGVTISVGLAGVDGRNATTADVVKAADKAMYRAKNDGRNRVVA